MIVYVGLLLFTLYLKNSIVHWLASVLVAHPPFVVVLHIWMEGNTLTTLKVQGFNR